LKKGNKKFDIIIIGGRHNGLICAAYLAAQNILQDRKKRGYRDSASPPVN
jgi:glycine/D-amino acid oxidase-like deaminating enzyme